MKTYEITRLLETIAPLSLQESYDNSGLIVGHPEKEVQRALICLDATEAVIDEAIEAKCDLVIAHHPIVFGGLKKINGKNYVERVVIKAIRHDISIYAIHTNLDNVLKQGVNSKIADLLGLEDRKILRPMADELLKVVVFVPTAHLEAVRQAMCDAGAGKIGHYDECSFSSEGRGSFRGDEHSNAFVGEKNRLHFEPENRLEVIVPTYQLSAVLKAMVSAHPYEEVAHDIYPLKNSHAETGAGMIGRLGADMSKAEFLRHVKSRMQADTIKYTATSKDTIRTVAICGGSGSFLIGDALRAGADAYVTGDIKYHEFFDGENQLMICDIGHYESEQFTINLIGDLLLEKIPNFAVIFTKVVTNPVNYYH